MWKRIEAECDEDDEDGLCGNKADSINWWEHSTPEKAFENLLYANYLYFMKGQLDKLV